MLCPSCNHPNDPSGIYCEQCAYPLSSAALSRSNITRVWIAGRNPACDIVVNEQSVSDRHCSLTATGGVFFVEDLGSTNGTYVNNVEIFAPVQVGPSDRITLGSQVPLPWPSAQELGAGPKVIQIGRDPSNDVVVNIDTVSSFHARIVHTSTGPMIEDLRSTNGLFVNNLDNRVSRSPLQLSDSVYLGSYRIPASRLLSGSKVSVGAVHHESIELTTSGTIGRAPECEYRLDSPVVSWKHAEFRLAGGQFEIRDLGSMNGTYVGGRRISSATKVAPGEEITIGPFSFQITGAGVLQKNDYRDAITLQVRDLAIRDRLDPISLTILPTELVAVMGPSGAGKSTFLEAVNGYSHPTGQVLLNGVDLLRNYNRFRLHMGYVPQEDIMHPQLTVSEALYFTARLRTDLRDDEIHSIVAETLASLDIEDCGNKEIGSVDKKVLSGGQRKRVNIAMELLSRPSLLFLDEPTSGLSSEDAAKVVRLLKELAFKGNTILVTIHQPSSEIFKQFDGLIVIARDRPRAGQLVYFGPAFPDSIEFFNPEAADQFRKTNREPGPDLLLKPLESKDPARSVSAAQLVDKFEASPQKARFVDARANSAPQSGAQAGAGGKPVRRPDFRQLGPLIHRNLLIKLRNTGQLRLFLLQAPIFAILLIGVYQKLGDFQTADFGKWKEFVARVGGTHFMMVVAAFWFGCNNAAREIVGEWAVFRRERMVSLKIPSYVASKLAVLGILCGAQCALLLGIVSLYSGLAAPLPKSFVTLWLASLVGVSLGLCLSALAKTTESAIAFLPLVVLPMILLGGGLKPLWEMGGVPQALSNVTPSKWAFEANFLEEQKARGTRCSFDPASPAACASCGTNPSLPVCEVCRAVPQGSTDIAAGHFPLKAPKRENGVEVKDASGMPILEDRVRNSWATCIRNLGIMFATLTLLLAAILKARDTR